MRRVPLVRWRCPLDQLVPARRAKFLPRFVCGSAARAACRSRWRGRGCPYHTATALRAEFLAGFSSCTALTAREAHGGFGLGLGLGSRLIRPAICAKFSTHFELSPAREARVGGRPRGRGRSCRGGAGEPILRPRVRRRRRLWNGLCERLFAGVRAQSAGTAAIPVPTRREVLPVAGLAEDLTVPLELRDRHQALVARGALVARLVPGLPQDHLLLGKVHGLAAPRANVLAAKSGHFKAS